MTLKSNGCIIFIAALSPTQLLVTSKHSLGAINGVPMSHAQMGELWLEKHLTSKGKTKADLAERLWKEGLTAVSEVNPIFNLN
jgi:tRNA ligase